MSGAHDNIGDAGSARLFCLDALRGLDIMLLVLGERLFAAANSVYGFPAAVARQFGHPPWQGFTMWDMIMPLFIFMCGAAVPFALGKRLGGRGYWRHVFARVALLWLLGMLCGGRLATLDLLQINPYSNTLQAIAAGYLVAAAVLAIPGGAGRIARWAAPLALALGYGALMHFCGDYTPVGNFPQRVETWVRLRILPLDSIMIDNCRYTWFLTTMMFGAMTLTGMNATDILRGSASPRAKFLRLLALGGGLVAFGLAVLPWVPSIKHVYTLSFTAAAMGVCVLLLALLYAVTDMLGFKRGWGPVLLFGRFSLFAYVLSELFGPAVDSAVHELTRGLPHVLGESTAAMISAIVAALAITGCVWLRKRLKEGVRP